MGPVSRPSACHPRYGVLRCRGLDEALSDRSRTFTQQLRLFSEVLVWPEDGAGPSADVGRTRRGVESESQESVWWFAVREAGKQHTIPCGGFKCDAPAVPVGASPHLRSAPRAPTTKLRRGCFVTSPFEGLLPGPVFTPRLTHTRAVPSTGLFWSAQGPGCPSAAIDVRRWTDSRWRRGFLSAVTDGVRGSTRKRRGRRQALLLPP